MAPAGEMWSVVTLSPSRASTRAPTTSAGGAGDGVSVSKNGGCRTYVDSSVQPNRAPDGAGRLRQRSSPWKTCAYREVKCSVRTADAIACWTSSADGHRSARCTSFPSASRPRGSAVRSMVIRPASA